MNIKRPLKTLQVVGALNTGGAETMILTATESLSGKCDMDFLVFGDEVGTLEDRAHAAGAEVLRIKSVRESGPFKFMKDLKQLLENRQYDVVHCHVHPASGLIMRVAEGAGVPIRITHSHTVTFPIRSVMYRLYHSLSKKLIVKHSTDFVACGEEAGQALFGDLWATSSGTVIPNGVNMDTFADVRDRRENIRAGLGFSQDQRLVGMVARLVDFKNHSFMLDVLALDKARGGDTILLAIGDGPLRRELEGRVAELGLADQVKFLGVRRDVPDLLGALDYVVTPSWWEGLPVALVETQAAGVPAIVSDQVAQESDLGLGIITWLPLEDPSAWQQALYREVPRPAPSVVRAKFDESGYSVESSAKKLLELYMKNPTN